METTLQERLNYLPEKPGVYLMNDKKGNVIYVGKAINLKKRVASYFRPANQKHPRTQALVNDIVDFETIVVDSEVESLILECNLIKRYRPRYNIRLNDDSNFLYLKLTTKELYPKISTARRVQKDLANYYGPHPKSKEVRQTLVLIRKLFKIRTCNIDFEKKKLERPCLDYHIKLCSGPCANLISQTEYQEQVNSTCLFLNGELDTLVENLTKKMDTFAKNLKYEEAGRLRDQLRAIQEIRLRQRIISPNQIDRDIIGFAEQSGLVCIQLMFIRSGKLIGQAHYFLDGVETYEEVDYLNEFLKQYYLHKSYIVARERRVPQEIILSKPVPEQDLILKWLCQKLDQEVVINSTPGDRENRMIDLANKNAKINLHQRLGQSNIRRQIIERGLKELQKRLRLPSLPFHIEGIDISTLQGENNVGSLVVFSNGEPNKKEYRRYKIRNIGQDDYAAIEEVVHRRVSRLIKEKKDFPDLLLIDGGLGQLNAAQSALSKLGVTDLPILALAKREEEIFIPYYNQPLKLPKTSKGLMILQRVRDEAHRFAVGYHRKLRRIKLTQNQLEEIPGFSKTRIQQLMIKFGSLAALKKADLKQIIETPTISKILAQRLYDFLHLKEED